jgi:hypothetical protein
VPLLGAPKLEDRLEGSTTESPLEHRHVDVDRAGTRVGGQQIRRTTESSHTTHRLRSIMKNVVECPCGEQIIGSDEDDLVRRAQLHLSERHPDHSYSRDEILFIARPALPGEQPPAS